jgi:hypothetical protein
VSDAIHFEAAPFEPGYQPETLPKIQVPDLAEDAQSLTAEALAQVPTLTELVDGEVVEQAEERTDPAPLDLPEVAAQALLAEPIQDEPAQADTWSEQLHVRMGKLTDDIHTLNARLDRLDERSKTKV